MDGETYRHAISGAGALSEGFLLSGEKQYVSTVMIEELKFLNSSELMVG
jgi:hypothetical protein